MTTMIPNQRVAARLRGRPGPRTSSGVRAQELAQRNVQPIHNALVIALKESAREHDIKLLPSQVSALADDITPIVIRLPYEKRPTVNVVSPKIDPTRVHLTPRERQVLMGLARGLSAEQTGYRLGITKDTVKSHLRTAYATLRARNGAHAVAICLKYGLLTPSELADI